MTDSVHPPSLSREEWLNILTRERMQGATKLLGFEVTDIDLEAKRVETRFQATQDFCNPKGTIQGGFLSAMLDEVCSVAAVVAYAARKGVNTLEAKTTYLKPAFPGPIIGVGEVIRLGRSIAFLEGSLLGPEGDILAKMSATTKVVEFSQTPAPFILDTERPKS